MFLCAMCRASPAASARVFSSSLESGQTSPIFPQADWSFFCWPGIPVPAHCSPHWPHFPWKDTPCVAFYHPPRIIWGEKDKGSIHFHLVGSTYNTDSCTDRWSWGCSVLADGSRESFYISNNLLSLHFRGFCLSYKQRETPLLRSVRWAAIHLRK